MTILESKNDRKLTLGDLFRLVNFYQENNADLSSVHKYAKCNNLDDAQCTLKFSHYINNFILETKNSTYYFLVNV